MKENNHAKRTFFALFLLAQLLIVTAVAQGQPYQIINTENSVVGGDLNKTVTTIQEGNNPLNRFKMTKVMKPTANQAFRAVMLILPPLGSGFQNYEVGENGDYNNSFAAYFARRNVAMVGLSQRVEPNVSPLSPRPGYFNVAGSAAEDRFFFANESLVHGSLAGFVNYATTRMFRDLNCGLAGETTFNNNLANFNGPVLMFASGHGFGTAMFDTSQLLTSADVTINFNAAHGHVDPMFATDHVKRLEQPIMNWVKNNF